VFRDSTGLWFSPSDLVVFLESEFAAFVDRWELEKRAGNLADEFRRAPKGRGICVHGDCLPDGPDEEADLYKRQGTKHELAFLKELYDSGHCIVEIVRGAGCGLG
jgi:hypothetical protein